MEETPPWHVAEWGGGGGRDAPDETARKKCAWKSRPPGRDMLFVPKKIQSCFPGTPEGVWKRRLHRDRNLPLPHTALTTLLVLQGGGWKRRPTGGRNFPRGRDTSLGTSGRGWKRRPPEDSPCQCYFSTGRDASGRIYMVGVLKTLPFALLVLHLRGVEETPPRTTHLESMEETPS